MVEDDPADVELMLAELERAGLRVRVDATAELAEMRRLLDGTAYDVVLADYDLRGWRGTEVLRELRERHLDVPVILVTGSLKEEFADECMREGASDFVLKRHLARLPVALRRAIAEKALHDRHARLLEHARKLSVAVDQGPAAVFITDTTGRIEYVNRRFTEITGYAAEDVLGQNPRLLQSGRTSSDVYEELWGTIAKGSVWRSEILNRRKNGELYWCQVSISPMTGPEGRVTHYVAVHEDITERRLAEEERRSSEERYRALTEASFDVIVLSVDGVIREVNAGWEKVLGHSAEEVVGRRPVDFTHDESREEVRRRVEGGIDGQYELTLVHKDGRPIRMEATAKAHDVGGGRPGRLTALRDVTEKRALEEQFRQSQKLEAVGRLAGGVAHDFNNVLTVILNEVQLLGLSQRADPSAVTEALSEIETAAKRAAALTRQLLTFSRRDVVQPAVLQPQEVLEGLRSMLRRVIGEDVELELRVGEDVGTVVIDRGHLEQVIVNLVVNARDAMPGGGQLRIELDNAELDEAYTETHGDATPGRYVVVAVSDTGTGMSAEVRRNLFEPFFTTKPAGRGTGLGLATSYGIVKECGGHFGVYSELGLGTTMKVYLPRSDAPAVDAGAEAAEAAAQLPITGTVLVVEDDEAVRRSAVRALERIGCTVLSASEARRALELVLDGGYRPDLLFTDVIMPGLTGPELAMQIRRRAPDTKILFTTGYTSDMAFRRDLLDEKAEVITKPYTLADLSRKVRHLLSA
jgi:PAS domain S-box-containing protein